LFIGNNLFELIQGNHANGLIAKKVVNQWRLHMVHLNGLVNKKMIIWDWTKWWDSMFIMQTKLSRRIEILLVQVDHGYEELN
jgi:hypothetical protein